jgi:hypothetical protein
LLTTQSDKVDSNGPAVEPLLVEAVRKDLCDGANSAGPLVPGAEHAAGPAALISARGFLPGMRVSEVIIKI